MKALVVFLLVFGMVTAANAQSGIRMSKRNSKRQKFIPEGTRVYCKYINSRIQNYDPNDKIKVKVIGILHILNDSTMQVDNEKIKINDLLRFGTRKSGANVGSAILTLGSIAIFLATNHDENSNSQSDLVLQTIGLLMEVVAFVDVVSRNPKKIAAWRLEVVR